MSARWVWFSFPCLIVLHMATVAIADRTEAASVLLASGAGAPAWAAIVAASVVTTRVLAIVVLPPAVLAWCVVRIRRDALERARRVLSFVSGGHHERPEARQAEQSRADATG